MFVFYNTATLNVEHVVIHAPEGYKEKLEPGHWIEVDDDIPPEEIRITPDKKVIRSKEKQEKKNAHSEIIELILIKGRADKQIDAMSFVGLEPFLLAKKYEWATSNPVDNSIIIEASIRGMSVELLVDKIKGDYQVAMNKLKLSETNKIKAHLAIHVAPDEATVQHVLNTFDQYAPVDGLDYKVI
jgi:hypothetical protein